MSFLIYKNPNIFAHMIIFETRELLSEPEPSSFPHSPPTSDRQSRSGPPLPRQASTDAKLGYYWNH